MLGGGDSGIPGLGVKCFLDSGFTEKISGIPGFHLCLGPGFQGKQFRDPGSVKKIRDPGIQRNRKGSGIQVLKREVKEFKERTLNNIDGVPLLRPSLIGPHSAHIADLFIDSLNVIDEDSLSV